MSERPACFLIGYFSLSRISTSNAGRRLVVVALPQRASELNIPQKFTDKSMHNEGSVHILPFWTVAQTAVPVLAYCSIELVKSRLSDY